MSSVQKAIEHSLNMSKLQLDQRIAYAAEHFADPTFYSDANQADQIMSWAISSYGNDIRFLPTQRVFARDELKILFDITRDRYDFDIQKQSTAVQEPRAILKSDYDIKSNRDFVEWDRDKSRFVIYPFADYLQDDLLDLIFAHEIPVNFPLSGLGLPIKDMFAVDKGAI